MKRYFRYLKEYKLQCILGPLFKWIEAALELLVPLVMADIIDTGVAAGDIGYVLRGGGLMLLMGAVGFACALFSRCLPTSTPCRIGSWTRSGPLPSSTAPSTTSTRCRVPWR